MPYSMTALCRQAAAAVHARLPSPAGNGKGPSLIERLAAAGQRPPVPRKVFDQINVIRNAAQGLDPRMTSAHVVDSTVLSHQQSGRPTLTDLQKTLDAGQRQLHRMRPGRMRDACAATLDRARGNARVAEVRWSCHLTQAQAAGSDGQVALAATVLGGQHPAVRRMCDGDMPAAHARTLAQRVHSQDPPSTWFQTAHQLYQCGLMHRFGGNAPAELRARRDGGFGNLALARADLAQAVAYATCLSAGPRREMALEVLGALNVAMANATAYWRGVLRSPGAAVVLDLKELACSWLGEADPTVAAHRAHPRPVPQTLSACVPPGAQDWKALVAASTVHFGEEHTPPVAFEYCTEFTSGHADRSQG